MLKRVIKDICKCLGIYDKISHWKAKRVMGIRRQYYNEYNKELLFLVDDILTKNGYSYWLNFGTLLGAYRDHAFIPHDNDLDISMFWEDHLGVKEVLIEGGLNLFATFYFGDSNAPESIAYRFEYKKVFIDIDFHLRDISNPSVIRHYGALFLDNVDYTKRGQFNVVQVEEFTNPFSGLMKLDFLGRQFNVPSNIEEYLIANYGPNYRTPDSKSDYHDYAQNIHIYPISEKVGYILQDNVK
jgi:hypothetical protein